MLPEQTFGTLAQLIDYINTFIIPNADQEIIATQHNNIENALANFIVKYTMNGILVSIVTSPGLVVTLPAPITVFTVPPLSVNWADDVQNEYYIINATPFDIPIANGYSFVDPFGVVQHVINSRDAVHIAKMTNESWLRINNGSGGGGLPTQGSHNGQTLFSNGSNAFWGDNVMQIPAGDGNYINATTWVNGSAFFSTEFSSPHFLLFWNDLSRFLLQNLSPPEWIYVPNGFQVITPGFDSATANVFLLFKGANS